MKKTITLSIIALLAGGLLVAKINEYPQGVYPPSGWGVTNPSITQENIKDNICNPSWSTSSIRPTSSYTTALKISQIKSMGYKDTNPSHYEEDHVISLELGGDPKSHQNLYPQPYEVYFNKVRIGAHEKDKVENFLHKEVCNGDITLAQAQKDITTNWVEIYSKISNQSVPLSSTDDY